MNRGRSENLLIESCLLWKYTQNPIRVVSNRVLAHSKGGGIQIVIRILGTSYLPFRWVLLLLKFERKQ